MLNNTNDKRFNTEPLDDSIKELLDICQQYNDKFSKRDLKSKNHTSNAASNNTHAYGEPSTGKQQSFSIMNRVMTDKSNTATNCDRNFETSAFHASETESSNTLTSKYKSRLLGEQQSTDDSVERLQQRQCELQSQLDEVKVVAKCLEAKQKRKLNGILDDQMKSSRKQAIDLDEDDDELIEFQQIENELRISELNRQLSNIQEEIRLRLYKRLLSKTTNGLKSSKENLKTAAGTSNLEPSVRRNSAQTDEATPTSSSCSNEHTGPSSSSTSDTMSSNSKHTLDVDLISEFEHCRISKAIDNFSAQRLQSENGNSNKSEKDHYVKTPNKADHFTDNHERKPIINSSIPVALDEADCMKSNIGAASQIPTSISLHRNNPSREEKATHLVDNHVQCNVGYNGIINCPANNDLERIDEGEEEDIDYYANSNVYRSIYEEKISPMMQAGFNNLKQHEDDSTTCSSAKHSDISFKKPQDSGYTGFESPPQNNDNRFNISNVNSVKRGNRPLTLYMPKPDEDIDLMELVQSLGHDLNIISAHLRLGPSSAHGYLYKLCSSNSKKWLKRFFYFDRNSKTLSYYETEEQLVKKSSAPKCTISFDEISDVYVDHRLSDISEKQKGTKKKNFVFILATIKRKYVLATTKAETMRAWIDILFTAAKANDYFQEIENDSFQTCLDSLPE